MIFYEILLLSHNYELLSHFDVVITIVHQNVYLCGGNGLPATASSTLLF